MRSHPDDAHMNRVRRDHDDGNARDLRRAPEMSSRPRSSSSRRSPRRRPVILIADDTTDTRDLYAEHFRTRGFTVVTAHDGPAVVNAALEHVPRSLSTRMRQQVHEFSEGAPPRSLGSRVG
jgi:hypothetical protein